MPGAEGTTTETGFYILGFKNGTVTTCEASEAMIIPYNENGEQVGLQVFPGMDEYAEAKANKSKQKSAKL